MLKPFRFITNLGSPTQWDVSDYLNYVGKISDGLPPDLISMTSAERYRLDSENSFWNATLAKMESDGLNLFLDFLSDSGCRRFSFEYNEVMVVRTDLVQIKCMPSMVMQEIVLRGKAIRHGISLLNGKFLVVICRRMRFVENCVQ